MRSRLSSQYSDFVHGKPDLSVETEMVLPLTLLILTLALTLTRTLILTMTLTLSKLDCVLYSLATFVQCRHTRSHRRRSTIG